MTTSPTAPLWTPWGKGFTRRSSPVALRAPSDERRRPASYTTSRDAARPPVRVWTLELTTGVVAAQFLYPLDKPSSFERDKAHGDVDRSDIKVSEAIAIGMSDLLVLERISHTTKIYRIKLDSGRALPRKYLNLRTRPTLEQLSAADTLPAVCPVLTKSLVMSSDDAPELPPDLEGMVMLSADELLLVNDNDFSVEGVRTQFWRVNLAKKVISKVCVDGG